MYGPDFETDPVPPDSGRPISIFAAVKIAAIAATAVALILLVEGVVPGQTHAVQPTMTADGRHLSVVSTGRPPIREDGTLSPAPSATNHPLVTPPPGPSEVTLGFIVGGVTDPPSVPRRPTAPKPTPTPKATPKATPVPLALGPQFPNSRPFWTRFAQQRRHGNPNPKPNGGQHRWAPHPPAP